MESGLTASTSSSAKTSFWAASAGALSASSACAHAAGYREDILTVLVTGVNGELFPSAVVFFVGGGVDSLSTIFTSIEVLVNSLQSSPKRRGTLAFYRHASFVADSLVSCKTTMEGEFCLIVSRGVMSKDERL